jgi:hypothetical protein
MKTPTETEAVLTPEDVRTILKVCSPDGVLVGGQALAFWSDLYEIRRPTPLVEAVSADVDFIGDSLLAEKLARAIGWKPWIPGMDDATFQTGKVTKKMPDGSIKQADFLSGVAGLTTQDVVRRAVEVDVPRLGHVRVMHPVDVLDSRIQNLHLLSVKRTPSGIAQAKLAIAVAAAFIRETLRTRGEKAALKLLERVAAMASGIGALRVHLLFDIDPLQAVPVQEFRTTTALHTKRWPQIVSYTSAQREKLRKQYARASLGRANKKVGK